MLLARVYIRIYQGLEIEGRREDQAEAGDTGHTAEDSGAQGLPHLGPCAGRDHQRRHVRVVKKVPRVSNVEQHGSGTASDPAVPICSTSRDLAYSHGFRFAGRDRHPGSL